MDRKTFLFWRMLLILLVVCVISFPAYGARKRKSVTNTKQTAPTTVTKNTNTVETKQETQPAPPPKNPEPVKNESSAPPPTVKEESSDPRERLVRKRPGMSGIGFSFGVLFQQHLTSQFKRGNGNYFRVNLTGDDNSQFYMHSEESTFNVEEGDAVSSSKKSVSAIGASLMLTSNLSVDLMIGSATVIIPTAVSATGPEAIPATRSTDPRQRKA